MAEHMNLYERARYYDVIFDRDVSREVGFLMAVFARFADPGLPESVLDVACGPGYHGRAFARQGISTWGIDLNEAMIQLAREKDSEEGVSATWIVGDMRKISLPEPVDLAFVMFDGLDALLTQDDLIAHFHSVAQNLKPGGLYIVDLSHPRDCSFGHYGGFHYQGTQNGVTAEITWATNQPSFDLVTGVADTELEMRVIDQGKELFVKDKAQERLLLPQEIELLCRIAGNLRVVDWYGDYGLGQPLDYTDNSHRMLAAIQRTEA